MPEWERAEKIKVSDLVNNGCKKASEYLKGQSDCLECPFPLCVYDCEKTQVLRRRNKEILVGFHKGLNTRSLAKLHGVNIRTVQRVVKTRGKPLT